MDDFLVPKHRRLKDQDFFDNLVAFRAIFDEFKGDMLVSGSCPIMEIVDIRTPTRSVELISGSVHGGDELPCLVALRPILDEFQGNVLVSRGCSVVEIVNIRSAYSLPAPITSKGSGQEEELMLVGHSRSLIAAAVL